MENIFLIITFALLVVVNALSFLSIYCMDLYDKNNLKRFNFLSKFIIFLVCLLWLVLLVVVSLLKLSPVITLGMGLVYLIPQTIHHFVTRNGQEEVFKSFLSEKVSIVSGLLIPIIIIAYLLRPLVDMII